jgi:quercetin dioxygenase-like cupin family protein
MKAIQYTEIAPTLLDGGQARNVAGRVVIGKADGAPSFCMRVFEIGAGGHTPRHSHRWEHEMFFHSGQGELFCDGKAHAVRAGSVVFVPGNAEHQIQNGGTDPLVVVCLVPSGAPEL